MFRALVVDDERLARDRIKKLLEQDNEIMVIGECASGTEAIRQINYDKPDIVFLDIEIPDADAFQVINAINPNVKPYIIFVTAYIKYLEKKYKTKDITCLLKPFDAERFFNVIRSVKNKLKPNHGAINLN